jgi:anti-sigma regulatory factor (Ser/Thr protein kinase)
MRAERRGAKRGGGESGDSGELLALKLSPHASSASEARAALTNLSPALPKPVVQDLQLLVSELVTNSLRHAGLGPGDVIDLRVKRLGCGVRVEVVDPGRRFAPAMKDRPSENGGWGLRIVDRVADRWGVEVPHSRVWFELCMDPC